MTSIPVKIVHITNPSRFYFRNLLTEKEEIDQINDIEEKIQNFVENLQESVRDSFQFYVPRVGEIVAFYSKRDKKWIRCIVDESKKFNDVETIIMWAIDYGLPLYTAHSKCVLPLPEHFRNPESKILTGCLPLMPSAVRYDYAAGGIVQDIKENWGDVALTTFQKFAFSSQKVLFNQSEILQHKDFLIGDLVFESVSLTWCLVDKEVASCVPDNLFLIYNSKLFTKHIERWNDNKRSGGVLKHSDANEYDSRFDVDMNGENVEQSVESSFTEECVRKVRDWQDRNEGFFNTSLCSDSEISFASNYPQKLVNSPVVYEPEVDKFSGVSAKELRRLLESQDQDQDEEQEKEIKQRYRSRMIFMPAGSSMNLTASFLDENFMSVSQVGLNEVGAGGGDDGFPVQQRDSIESMAMRLESQKI